MKENIKNREQTRNEGRTKYLSVNQYSCQKKEAHGEELQEQENYSISGIVKQRRTTEKQKKESANQQHKTQKENGNLEHAHG